MQVRLTIEPPITALAARTTANQADLDRITEYLDAGGNSDSYEAFETHDTHLHRAIAQAVHNGLLMNLFDVMSTARSLPVWAASNAAPPPPSAARTTTSSTPPSSPPSLNATPKPPRPSCATTSATSPTTCSDATSEEPPLPPPGPSYQCRFRLS